MQYAIINPPHTPPFAKMSKEELRGYYDWFMEVLPSKANELAEWVSKSEGFGTWKPDYTPQSLELLGKWFAERVGTRPRSLAEIDAIRRASPYPIDVPAVELSDETFALTFAVAAYLALVFLREYPSLRWHHALDGKGSIDYGQPVLTGFGKQQLNPVQLVVTLAYGVVSGRKGASGLRNLFDAWSKLVALPRRP